MSVEDDCGCRPDFVKPCARYAPGPRGTVRCRTCHHSLECHAEASVAAAVEASFRKALEEPLPEDALSALRAQRDKIRASLAALPRLAWKVRTLDEVRALVPRKAPKRVYYATRTCWWTVDGADLYRMEEVVPPPPAGSEAARALAILHKAGRSVPSLPCDPRGSVLMMTDDVEGFLRSAEEGADHYGRFGLKAFMSAYHGNVVVGDRPTSLETWDLYNDVLSLAGEKP